MNNLYGAEMLDRLERCAAISASRKRETSGRVEVELNRSLGYGTYIVVVRGHPLTWSRPRLEHEYLV